MTPRFTNERLNKKERRHICIDAILHDKCIIASMLRGVIPRGSRVLPIIFFKEISCPDLIASRLNKIMGFSAYV
jgi:hypothetical protein